MPPEMAARVKRDSPGLLAFTRRQVREEWLHEAVVGSARRTEFRSPQGIGQGGISRQRQPKGAARPTVNTLRRLQATRPVGDPVIGAA